MILVLTYKEYEQSTDPVIDWLLYYKASFIKIFIEDLLTHTNKYRIDVDKKKIFVDEVEISAKIKVVFYRRFEKYIHFKSDLNLGQINKKIDRESNGELNDLFNYIFYVLGNKIWFPHYSKIDVNKLEMLNIAESVGLNIPSSTITNSKEVVINFKQKKGKIIYKPIRQISYYIFGKYTYSPYTIEIGDDEINKLNDYFFPSLFQEKIESEFEIRCFYLDGDIFASAILINSEIKEVDIKLNFNSTTTKWMNYILPNDIKQKIFFFMNTVGLNTGSIDLLKTKDNYYYFLEVNPVGQYFAPSVNCNYYIEKKIAEWLINKNCI